MNRLFKILLLLLAPYSVLAQEEFTLEDAITYGLENNITLKNKILDGEIRKEYAFEIMTQGFPKLNVSLDYTNAFEQQVSIVPAGVFGPTEQEFIFAQPHSATLRADLTQLIFDARYVYGLKARNALKQTADIDVELAIINTRESITKAYYAAIISQESYKLLAKNEETLQQILFETKQTYEEGLIDELSVNRLELNLLNVQSQIERAKNQAENSLLNLKFILGMPHYENITLSQDLELMLNNFDWNLSQTIDANNRVETQLLDNQLELKKYDIKQTRSALFPSLYGFANYGTLAQRQSFDFFNTNLRWFDFGSVGFSLKIPVFDGLEARSKVQQRKLEMQQIENNKANFEASLILEVTNAQNNVANAINDYNNQKENLALANKILNKTIIMFNEGVGSSFELAQAQQDYTTTMINYTSSIYNLLTSKIELNKALGSL